MSDYLKGGSAIVRAMNLSSVLGHLHVSAPLSRAQLARITGLNKSTVSSLVDDLIMRRLVCEEGTYYSATGRPAYLLRLNPKAGCVIGVEMGVGFISVIITDFTGKIIWRRDKDYDSVLKQQEIISQTSQSIAAALQYIQEIESRPLGIGLTLPGLVDVDKGLLVFSPNLQWRDVPLGEMFHEQTGLPVFVDNDANAAAFSEHLFGLARKARNFIFIIAGVGVGGGLFLNGDLYRGMDGFAGEIGHTNLNSEHNRPCRCGNRGCWENMGNQYALIERVRARLEVGRSSIIPELLEKHHSPLTVSWINYAAEAGDKVALEALNETGEDLGLGIANLINTLNPELVVIGGTLSIAGKFILPAIKKVIEQRALFETRQKVKVELSTFGPDASVMGAVALVIKDILLHPLRIKPILQKPEEVKEKAENLII